MSRSPTQRTLEYLRDEGYRADVVERWNPHAKVRKDLFDIIDIVAVPMQDHVAPRVLMVQCTSDSNVAARIAKMRESPVLERLKAAGVVVQVWGWGKKGERGKRKLWRHRIVFL